jgi:hypothetical protein
MRVCDAFANETLTRKHRCHLLGGFAIGARQQMRIAIEHGTWVVPEAGGDDVNGDSMHEHQSRGRMPERVQSPARDLCPPTQLERRKPSRVPTAPDNGPPFPAQAPPSRRRARLLDRRPLKLA